MTTYPRLDTVISSIDDLEKAGNTLKKQHCNLPEGSPLKTRFIYKKQCQNVFDFECH